MPAALAALVFGAAWGWGLLAVGADGDARVACAPPRAAAALARPSAARRPCPRARASGTRCSRAAPLERERRGARQSWRDALARMRARGAGAARRRGDPRQRQPHRVVQRHRAKRTSARPCARTSGRPSRTWCASPSSSTTSSSSDDAVRMHPAVAGASRCRCSSFRSASRRRLLLSRDVTQAERVDACGATSSPTCRTSCARRSRCCRVPRDAARVKLDPPAHARLPGHDAGAGRAHAAPGRGPAHAVGARVRAAGSERASAIAVRPLLAAPEGRRRGALRRTPHDQAELEDDQRRPARRRERSSPARSATW